MLAVARPAFHQSGCAEIILQDVTLSEGRHVPARLSEPQPMARTLSIQVTKSVMPRLTLMPTVAWSAWAEVATSMDSSLPEPDAGGLSVTSKPSR